MCWMALFSLEQPRAKAERGATKIVSQEKTQQTPAIHTQGHSIQYCPPPKDLGNQWGSGSLKPFHSLDLQVYSPNC